MAILFVDLVALSETDPWMLDQAAEWAARKLPILWFYDANRPKPDVSKLPRVDLLIPTAGPTYATNALQLALDHLNHEFSQLNAHLPPHVQIPKRDKFLESLQAPGLRPTILSVPAQLDGKGITAFEAARFGLVPRFPKRRVESLSEGRPTWKADQVELLEAAHERDRLLRSGR